MAEEAQVKEDLSSPKVEVAGAGNVPAAVKKVELDLDDAPFLQTEEKAPAKQELPEDLDGGSADEEKKKRRKKLILLGAAIGGGLLIVGAALAWWFIFRAPPPPPPPAAPDPEVVVVPSTPAPAGEQEIVREFAPFIVPTLDPDGKTGFLICRFSAISKDQAVNQEIQQQLMPLRDAIYYYLRGKDNAFLLDARNGDQIKHDLVTVFNDYLTQGKIEDIVFESYLSW